MRLAQVIPTYAPAYRYGGPIRALEGLANALGAAGDEVTVYATDVDGQGRLDVPLERPVPRGRHAVRYFAASAPRRLARSPRLAAALARELPSLDLVHLHSVFLWPTWAAARAARRAGRPYVVSPRGMLDRALIGGRGALRKRLWLALVERRTLAGAARIVATTEAEAAAIRELGLALAPVAVVPNGVDPDELAAPPPDAVSPAVQRAIDDHGAYVLNLGRLSWKKRIDLLIDALARVAELRLVVAGDDDEALRPRLEARARAQGVAGRVAFVGPVEGADRAALYHGARVFALASAGENFGNAVLEAMACAVPVVVTPAVGLADEVRRSGGGRVVAADAEALAAALRELATKEVAREVGERGRRAALAGYAWPVVAARMRELYRETVAA